MYLTRMLPHGERELLAPCRVQLGDDCEASDVCEADRAVDSKPLTTTESLEMLIVARRISRLQRHR